MFPGEQFSGTPETGGYLVEKQQDTVFTAQLRRLAQVLRMIETHAARTLYNGFQYQSCQFFVMLFHNLPQRKDIAFVPLASETAFGSRREPAYRQCRTKQAVHSRHRVAHRHGVPRISMISRTDGHKITLSGMSHRILVLHRHFQRNLYSHRTAVGIKDVPHRGRDYLQQLLA